ncbi:hypothetical protein EZ456_21940 [Pedobacter psychrodurus]|uniref:Uncharacterized protein n=1 Tax=Pedobacter psychrodurus TaxID=2530456 RepID=A0A4R0PPQ6_9SPHI|nr:hypothetical protein [Pedobacter psychrodurus]TCD18105.1 hypothetical protein EZ456_21940 [Pedobacter psychrodurus]
MIKKQIDSILDVVISVNLNKGIKPNTLTYNASKKINYEEGMVRSILAYTSKYNNAERYEQSFKYAVKTEALAKKLNNPQHLALLNSFKFETYKIKSKIPTPTH